MGKVEEHTSTRGELTPSTLHILLAWSVHFITASGIVWGLLALIAAVERQWVMVFVWMAASLVVDSIDGTLARLVQVKRVLPGFDGALLDNIADYVTYVVVPAFFFYVSDLLPPLFSLPAVALILLVSGYQFCQGDAKTEDHYFKGFPSYWNILAFYLFILALNPWINLSVIILCCVLIFVPVKYIYPSRAPQYQYLTLTLAALWGVICTIILMQFPQPDFRLILASLFFVVYYVGISLHLMLSPKK
ncbi:MAG: CDP-alcohol phosphatidyltransferase family protein [Caldilineaceae bacterium]|nr:CDP-alcohol phosphatidyltransferase family protein [Caldilineaceae bacterium]